MALDIITAPELLLPLLMLITAFFYAAVGHGGASGYLALMAVFGVSTHFMKGSAWTLNLFVAGISFIQYYRTGHFKWKLFLPFALTSVPLAFLGGTIELDPKVYKQILGIFLLVAIIRIIWSTSRKEQVSVSFDHAKLSTWVIALALGGALGLISGLVGIGGGIILSPLILILGWGDIKQTAAVSALFIFVNSASGLVGYVANDGAFSPMLPLWIAAALVGGTLGAYTGAWRFNHNLVLKLLAVVLVVASIKLLGF